ncbi:hypothetical protein GMJAKD_06975 [Candidatus Electrothrix aarhusensis]
MTVLISTSKNAVRKPLQEVPSQKAFVHQAAPVATVAANNHLTCLLINSS